MALCVLWTFSIGRAAASDSSCALRCVACGEIIDLMIVQNRIRLRDQRLVRRQKKPHQLVCTVPTS
jgi:hypothetical protein